MFELRPDIGKAAIAIAGGAGARAVSSKDKALRSDHALSVPRWERSSDENGVIRRDGGSR